MSADLKNRIFTLKYSFLYSKRTLFQTFCDSETFNRFNEQSNVCPTGCAPSGVQDVENVFFSSSKMQGKKVLTWKLRFIKKIISLEQKFVAI